MPVAEIAQARKCGQMHFHIVYHYPGDLNRILEFCHLKPEADRLLQVDRENAVGVLKEWLQRDAAYRTELMKEKMARRLAEAFVEEFSDDTSRFFTNGRWDESRLPASWQPLTESVFDGGLIVESGKGNHVRHVCIWFEDED